MSEIVNKKFFFVRHGMTSWNEKQLCQGQIDIELSDAGRLEAKLLGESLKPFSFAKIFASPLKRALETAAILQAMLPSSEIHPVDELKERSWGELEGISSEEMYRIEALEEMNPLLPHEKGVEDRESFKRRIAQGMNFALNQDGTPLIVSHGRVFLSLCELLNIPLIRQIPNTTLIECSPSKNGWEVKYEK